jgi:hypothetical protein
MTARCRFISRSMASIARCDIPELRPLGRDAETESLHCDG